MAEAISRSDKIEALGRIQPVQVDLEDDAIANQLVLEGSHVAGKLPSCKCLMGSAFLKLWRCTRQSLKTIFLRVLRCVASEEGNTVSVYVSFRLMNLMFSIPSSLVEMMGCTPRCCSSAFLIDTPFSREMNLTNDKGVMLHQQAFHAKDALSF